MFRTHYHCLCTAPAGKVLGHVTDSSTEAQTGVGALGRNQGTPRGARDDSCPRGCVYGGRDLALNLGLGSESRPLSLPAHKKVVVVQLLNCLSFWDRTDCSTPGFPVLHCLLESAQVHAH